MRSRPTANKRSRKRGAHTTAAVRESQGRGRDVHRREGTGQEWVSHRSGECDRQWGGKRGAAEGQLRLKAEIELRRALAHAESIQHTETNELKHT